MRVALVLEHYEPKLGGLESWTEGLASWLVERGHSVVVVATGGASPDAAIDLELVEPSPSPLHRAEAIARRLALLRVDIVHDTGSTYGGDVFQPQTGSRLVNSNLDIAALPWRRWIKAKLSRPLRHWRQEIGVLEARQFADASRLIAVSRMVRDQIAARYRLDASAIAVIHNGVDTATFAPVLIAPFRAAARARWGLQGCTVFLLVANNFQLKGVAVAIRGMAGIARTMPKARLVVVGNGQPDRYLALAQQAGVADRVRFLGRIERIADAYAAADIAIQPTHYDACSLATLEGLACGLPTITTAANGAGELIDEGRQGYVLPRSTDAVALAAAMLRLDDVTTRERMGSAARQLALAHDLRANHARVEAFYQHRLSLRSRQE